MSSFDGWEARLYGDAMALPLGQLSDNELMHFRTKGSKNGVRRYQQPDGTWTPLGLKERKAREGWGETRKERKAAKAVAKAEKKAEKAERKASKSAARAERMAAAKQKLRKNDLRNLSDEELQKKIARVKMELEYKELTKSPLLKFGNKAVETILNYKVKKSEAAANLAKTALENNRVKATVIQAKEATKSAKYNAEQARQEALQAKQAAVKQMWDTKGGLATKRKAELTTAKTNYRNTTIGGAIGKHFNNMVKYHQDIRTNPQKVKEHQRAVELAKIALEREREKTEQERQKTKGGRK